MPAHNDARRHWEGDHGNPFSQRTARILGAMQEFKKAKGSYIDVHQWYFTPETFRELIGQLHDLKLTTFTVERVYPTLYNGIEFWAVLKTCKA